jgi:AraC-like DNA-binding protein/mannose-6-phosphate isomerase-like protein (cupin superfamily)
MVVSARSAKDLLATATPDVGFVDMRATIPVRAGTFLYEGENLVTGWHHHDLHQVEYALEGVAHVETGDARYLVPPQQAIWIPAGLEHCTTLQGRSVAVFFDACMLVGVDGRAHVLAAAPVLREMMTYAIRWPIDRQGGDETAERFFEALVLLVRDWIDQEVPMCLPTSADPIVRAAMEYTQAHLMDVTFLDVARGAGVSERTLRRRFLIETGATWQQYLHRSRLITAAVLLTQSRRSIMNVALEVGFDSVSAFSRAFCALAGENPSQYRRRRFVDSTSDSDYEGPMQRTRSFSRVPGGGK